MQAGQAEIACKSIGNLGFELIIIIDVYKAVFRESK
jgi:hypothetical protein